MMIETLFFLFGVGIWNPSLQSVAQEPIEITTPFPKEWTEPIPLTAKAALLLDVDSMGLVFQKNVNTPYPMASLTKMMTALIILENHSLNEKITIPAISEYIEGSSMKLKPGDVLTVKDLLRGLMISSGNDAATVLAIYHSQTVFAFVEEMNARAKQLSLFQTHFQNPHGLDAPEHYTSARDLTIIGKMLLQYPVLRDIVNTTTVDIESQIGEKYELVNTNLLLDSPFPVYGLKTGTTENAGECLFLLTRVNGKEYFVVLLGSIDRYLDAKTILWHVMGKPESTPLPEENE